MYYLHAIWLATYDPSADARFVYSTCYPYWLSSYNGNVKAEAVGSPAAFTKPGGGEKAWIADTNALYATITATTVVPPYQAYLTWKGTTSPEVNQVQQWIAGNITPLWQVISPTDTTFSPAYSASQLITGVAGTTATNNNFLLYYRVQSVDDDAYDGRIFSQDFEGLEQGYVVLPKTTTVFPPDTTAVKRKGTPLASKTGKLTRFPQTATMDVEDDEPELNDADEDEDEGQGDSDYDDDAIVTSIASPSLALDEAPIVQDPDGFYFYCTDVDQPGVNAYALPAGLLNDFVTVLDTGSIALDAAPSSPSGQPQVPANFSNNDVWNQWFTGALGAKTMQAYGTTTSLTGFSFSITLSGQDLEFLTDDVNLAFGLNSGINGIPQPGIVDTDNMIMFGLNPQSPKITNLSIKDAFAFAKLDVPTVLGLLDSITLTVDPSTTLGKRNAVWFIPEQTFKTLVRLTWDVTDLSPINSFFSFLTGFSITSAYAIAVQTSNRVIGASGAKAVTEGAVTIVADAQIVPKSNNNINFTMAVEVQPDRLDLIWQIDSNSKGGLTDIISWLASLLSIPLDFDQWLNSDSMKSPTLRQLKLTVGMDANNKPVVQSFSCTFEVSFTFGKSSSDDNIAVRFVFSWSEGLGSSLIGSLWPRRSFRFTSVL